MTSRFLGIDCEMTGLDPRHALIEAYFEVVDHNFKTIDELLIKLKHDEYVVSPQALEVTGINLLQHHNDPISEYKTTAGKKLYNFLYKYSSGGSDKLTVVGHGVKGDLQQIWSGLLNRETFEQFTSYRYLDTSVIAQFLQFAGKIPSDVTGSVESLVNYYKIPDQGSYHNAKSDTRYTLEICRHLLKELDK